MSLVSLPGRQAALLALSVNQGFFMSYMQGQCLEGARHLPHSQCSHMCSLNCRYMCTHDLHTCSECHVSIRVCTPHTHPCVLHAHSHFITQVHMHTNHEYTPYSSMEKPSTPLQRAEVLFVFFEHSFQGSGRPSTLLCLQLCMKPAEKGHR